MQLSLKQFLETVKKKWLTLVWEKRGKLTGFKMSECQFYKKLEFKATFFKGYYASVMVGKKFFEWQTVTKYNKKEMEAWNSQESPFYVVAPSLLPFLLAFTVAMCLFTLVFIMNKFVNCPCWTGPMYMNAILLVVFIWCWVKDLSYESDVLGYHTKRVRNNLYFGFSLFIISESMLFFSFFWAFGHLSMNPSIWVGGVWPPVGIKPLSAMGLPLVNTILLFVSGVLVTFSHAMVKFMESMGQFVKVKFKSLDMLEDKQSPMAVRVIPQLKQGGVVLEAGKMWSNASWYSVISLGGAICLGMSFSVCQIYEYSNASFSISDGVYGSTFFSITGLHGLHVLIGTSFLSFQFSRSCGGYFKVDNHVGYSTAIWYWHFVDFIWFVVFGWVYIWGGGMQSFL